MHTAAVVLSILEHPFQALDFAPDEESLSSLTFDICEERDLGDAIHQCVNAAASNYGSPMSSHNLAILADALDRGIHAAQSTIAKYSMTPDDQVRTMDLLFETAGWNTRLGTRRSRCRPCGLRDA